MRPTRLLFSLAGFAAALLLVARTTGAGWTVVVVCCVAATIAVGAAWPGLAVRRVTVAVTTPADATAGREFMATLAVGGTRTPLRARLVDPPGPWVHSRDVRGETVHRDLLAAESAEGLAG